MSEIFGQTSNIKHQTLPPRGTNLQIYFPLDCKISRLHFVFFLIFVSFFCENYGDNLIYQVPELTLQQLADKLGLPNYQVSQILNDGMKRTFYDIVNGYRVEEAKRLLLDSKNSNYTILSVGFEAGFNSKTSFNTIFKKFTGFTPSEYRSKHQVAVPA